jgi:hypothetical protein
MSEKLYNSYRPLTTDPTKYPDLQRVFLGLGPIMKVSKEAEQMSEMMATASTQDPPKAPFVSELPPEKPSSAQTDPVYERGLKAEQSLIDFVKKAAEEPGKSPSRGVFGSFRPERAIRSWYENNPDLAKDYNAANIQIGNASDQEEVIEKLSKNINDSQPFGSLGRETVNEDFRLLTPIPKATGGVSQVPTEEPISQEAPNGPPSGVIGSQNASPEETVADDIPMDVPEGSFIINAAAAEVAGYGDIKTMIMDAIGVARRLGVEISTGDDKVEDEEAVDLLVSKGEVYIEPTLAKIIGYDVLEKINNRGKREVARRQQEAEAQQQPPQAPPQPQMAQEGGFVKKKFADGGETSTEYPDYIKKYFMPEIDYHLETIRTKTVARNQYGQPVTALTSGVLRGDKIYEIPTYDRKGGILSRKQVESSLDSYIEKYGDFGIPQDQYRSLMKEKETYKQNLYKKDSRFQVTDDSITQTVTLPEKGQKNSQGFVPKK